MLLTIANALGVSKMVARLGLIGIALLLVGLAYLSWKNGIISDYEAEVQAEVLNVDVVAKEDAAIQRANDTAETTQAEKDRNDAINQAPDSQPSAARNKLNCERLRRAGKDTDSIPACR
jgi:hypothetical protein